MNFKRLFHSVLLIVCILTLTACGDADISATKEPFPKFEAIDFNGNKVTNEIFKDSDATIVNFWTNGCGSCIAEMPDLEEYYKRFKKDKINLISFASSAGDSKEQMELAQTILKQKGVTFKSIIPNIKSSFYSDFICKITGFPITYIVDSNGDMIGAPILGVVKSQEEKLLIRLEEITK
jgi:thiol-disulfide isomerase/thioredoxin